MSCDDPVNDRVIALAAVGGGGLDPKLVAGGVFVGLVLVAQMVRAHLLSLSSQIVSLFSLGINLFLFIGYKSCFFSLGIKHVSFHWV